ncbi:4-hydroxy-tetrahydrodipicolinate reductase [Posidoniimonas polymericola]|uniref:4-hydroxy-tetrahydrodipicolinate reductase n=1 Tax=Posidoniimonas polymericola TaxID=2528002 RepID=A0A5C5XY19_9BACT|nr:4-hydroxy-tetrahydrodipicolinate reductase [Posidoniimonas polymericola]TWT66815.1 4-hydroxy-tetrahydrodipicolinate reductase [Posidoniimonas polymericola]
MAVKTIIHGAGGRMGQRLIAVGSQDADIQLVGAVDSEHSSHLAKDAGELAGVGTLNLPVSSDYPDDCDAVIDFSVPEATDALVDQCVKRGWPLVFATTGLSDEQEQRIRSAAEVIPIVKAASMSATVNLTMKLSEIAGRTLKNHSSGVDVEIIERHHRFKEDAPSGTALAFGRIIGEAMGVSGETHGRSGRPGQRPRNEIGYHAVRTGDNPGEHTIVFGLLGETIELKVAASNRDCYATGAFTAAKWLEGKPAGLYDMQDVLGLR